MRTLVLLVPVLLATGCAGGLHRRGENQVAFHASFTDPFRDHPLWGIGKGTAESEGYSLTYHRFFADRGAVALSITPLREFHQNGADVEAYEYQLGVRGFPIEFTLLGLPTAVYVEVLGGRLHADAPIPPQGTSKNWTQDFGIGFEWMLSERWSGTAGYRLRHMSNGDGNVPGNPSQNEHQFLVGFALRW